MSLANKTVYLAGHRGMVGSALHRALSAQGCKSIITRTHSELDLCDQSAVNAFYKENKIDYVIIAAAKVGGIYSNDAFPADFIYDNLAIELNLINGAYRHGVENLLFLGSTCIYPRDAKQPITESALLTGTLEPTNEAYAIAKIAGIKMCESYNRQHDTDYRCVMPTNLYGPNDYFHPKNSHVIPALIRRLDEACTQNTAQVKVWGSGTPVRDFLYVDDMASACLHIATLDKDTYWSKVPQRCSHINVGSGHAISIGDCAKKIAQALDFNGAIEFDTTMPDGMPQKMLDISLIQSLGWQPQVTFNKGIDMACRWYRENINALRD